MGVRGNGTLWAFSTLALTLVFGACKEEQVGWPPKAGYPKGETKTASPSSSGGFTPAEIRRDRPVELDTAGLVDKEASIQDPPPASPVDAIPPKTVVSKPAPPVAAVSAPADPNPAKPVVSTVPPKTVEPATPAPATGIVTPPGETGDWVMQVNVHRSEADAKAQIAKLAQQGVPAYAIPVPTGDASLSGNYWRVRVGRFQSRAEAQAYGNAVLEPKGLKFWVDKKSNEAKQGK